MLSCVTDASKDGSSSSSCFCICRHYDLDAFANDSQRVSQLRNFILFKFFRYMYIFGEIINMNSANKFNISPQDDVTLRHCDKMLEMMNKPFCVTLVSAP